tara:strand:+ start:320 stop:1453 length:1134 start_codon:yes stop_codon:yes gene_type:complete
MRLSFLSFLICFHLLWSKGYGQNALKAKYREWLEDDDRIEVSSWYAETEIEFENDWSFEFLGTIDAWSGATPYGLPPSSSIAVNDWLQIVPEEIRKAGLFTIKKETPNHDFSFEYGISDEPDYLSRSYALQYSYKLAAETLIVTSGFSLQDDSVKDFTGSFVEKKTPSLSAGLTRILDKFTSISFNFTYSWPSGYLSDPYKNTPHEIYGSIGLAPENRPDKREIFIFYSELSRYLDSLKIGTHLSYRYFQDDHRLRGHTIEIEANKRLGEKWILSPRYRFYTQNQTSFYSPKIREREFFDNYMRSPDSSEGPFYSADHRLSSFDSHGLGLKLSFLMEDNLTLDAGYDRYLTKGNDGVTDARVYPDANVFTIGLQWEL